MDIASHRRGEHLELRQLIRQAAAGCWRGGARHPRAVLPELLRTLQQELYAHTRADVQEWAVIGDAARGLNQRREAGENSSLAPEVALTAESFAKPATADDYRHLID